MKKMKRTLVVCLMSLIGATSLIFPLNISLSAYRFMNDSSVNSLAPSTDADLSAVQPATETHCLGRFLIDLPKGTQVKADYTTGGSRVTTFSQVGPEEFNSQVAARLQTLQESMHGGGGAMFVDRDDISPNHVTLVSWASESSRRVYRYDEFHYVPDGKVLYVFTGQGTAHPDSRRKAAESQRRYAEKIRYRKPLEIPEEHGFCIDEGLVMDSGMNKEEMNVGFFFSDYPHVNMYVMSFTTKEDMSPTPSGGRQFVRLNREKVLHNGKRKWGTMTAKEVLYKYKDGGQWFYEFEIKMPSKGGALDYPFMSIKLETGSYERTDEKGRRNVSPFSNDQEAIQLWDNIVGSLRLRRGAVEN